MILKNIFFKNRFHIHSCRFSIHFSGICRSVYRRCEVEEGENVVNWEEGIFGPQKKKKEKKKVESDKKEEQKPEIVKKEDKPAQKDLRQR
jgi:hypothetical protein